jgi:hypothetical protein
MSYDEDEGFGGSFKMSGYDDDNNDEPLDIPEEINDFGLDEEDPESRYS